MVQPINQQTLPGETTDSTNANIVPASSSSSAAAATTTASTNTVTATAPPPQTNGNGNNSDNSNYSLGNTSFGFNFDIEEGMSNPSPPNSDIGGNDHVSNANATTPSVTAVVKTEPDAGSNSVIASNPSITRVPQQQAQAHHQQQQHQQQQQQQQQIAQLPPPQALPEQREHTSAAAQAVNKLHLIASQSVANAIEQNNNNSNSNNTNSESNDQKPNLLKRKLSMSNNNGYNSDDERSNTNSSEGGQTNSMVSSSQQQQQEHNKLPQHEQLQQQQPALALSTHPTTNQTQSSSAVTSVTHSNELTTSTPNDNPSNSNIDTTTEGGGETKKRKKIDDVKREERNAREKERSYRIAAQINELRTLLSNGGVIVPKGTKNAVLTEAANYIKMLQQHQFKSEIHRQQLIQQMQMIGSGAIGPQASNAIRHVAAQNGVWSLGNFGGLPPRTTASGADPNVDEEQQDPNQQGQQAQQGNQSLFMKTIDDNDYRCIFNSCAIPMAIASMGGAFIDCNQLFIELSQYSKQEICSLTIFNLTARSDLQHAFDLVSQMISPPTSNNDNKPPQQSPSCVLRGNLKTRNDLGLNITLIRDDDGVAKCFCVSLIKNPTSPFDTSVPVHATPVLVQQQQQQQQHQQQQLSHQDINKQCGNLPAPTFMSG